MALRKALWLQNTSYQPDTDRLGLSSLLYPSGSTSNPLEVRAGILPRTTMVSGGQPFQVTVNAGMILNVGAGNLVYPNWHASNQGAYLVTNDAMQTVTIATSDPTFGRYDVIYVQVKDSGFGDLTDDTILAVAQGTPAASPAVPSVPTGAFKLAQIFVGAGVGAITSGNITDLRTETATIGGRPRVANAAGLPVNPYEGQTSYQLDTHTPVYWNGSEWAPESLPNEASVHYLVGTADLAVSSTTYVNVSTAATGSPASTLVSVSITKSRAASKISVDIASVVHYGSGVGPLTITFGALVNGVDYDVVTVPGVVDAWSWSPANGFLTIPASLAVGTYTVQLRVKVQTGSTWNLAANTYVALRAREVSG